MFHFTFKDYLFLILIALAIAVLGGALYIFGNSNKPTLSAVDGLNSDNARAFSCAGDTFTINAKVSDFTFKEFPYIKPGIENECFWTTNNYVISYMKPEAGKPQVTIEELSQSGGTEGLVDSRVLSNTVWESKAFDSQDNLYYLSRVVIAEKGLYFLVMNSKEDISLDDSRFRSFVDSFQVIK